MLIETTSKRPLVCPIHVGVGLAHGVEMGQAEPAVVDSAAGTLDVEAAVDSDAWCVAASTELAADALEILLQGLVLRIAASLALFACFSEVVLRLAGGAVDGNALWADNFAHVLDDGEVLVAVLSGAVDEVIRILLAFASDSVLEQGTVRDW